MPRSFVSFTIRIVAVVFLISCQKVDSSKIDTKKEIIPLNSTSKGNSSSEMISEKEVIAYLSNSGFLLTIKGREVYREDQLSDANPDAIIRSIEILSTDKEKNKTAIFYLMVAGTSLSNTTSQQLFIKKNMSEGNYLAFMDKMVKFLQRQDRPTIKQALLNTTASLTIEQCIEYLHYIGYLSSTVVSNFTYDSASLKPLPIFFKLALLNKLKVTEGRNKMVYEQLKMDLGISN